jgi:phosphoglycerate dehydrogenase-like enzyme
MPVSRRTFLTAAPAAAAAAQVSANPLRVVTTYAFTPEEVAKIEQTAAEHAKVEIIICKTREDFRERLREADIVYGALSGKDLDYAPKLKWWQAGGAGMEGADDTLWSSNLIITNYARTFAHGISETAIGLLLCLTRGISRYYMPQFAKRQMNPVGTPKSADHVELVGKTMGIVGMGGIGSMIARRAYYGFDMKIIATDAKPLPKPEYVAELHDPAWFPKMVPAVDVLVAAAPQTAKTERMFNESVFRSMKKSAFFLAMSRGRLYDDMALVKALKGGWISGAGLDVFPVEPPPSNHPIFDCPNVVMTAHTSGWSPDRQVRLIDVFAENVRRYAGGIPLINQVDKNAHY